MFIILYIFQTAFPRKKVSFYLYLFKVYLKDEFAVSFHSVKLCFFFQNKTLTFAAKCCNGSPSSLYVKLPNSMPSVSLSPSNP